MSDQVSVPSVVCSRAGLGPSCGPGWAGPWPTGPRPSPASSKRWSPVRFRSAVLVTAGVVCGRSRAGEPHRSVNVAERRTGHAGSASLARRREAPRPRPSVAVRIRDGGLPVCQWPLCVPGHRRCACALLRIRRFGVRIPAGTPFIKLKRGECSTHSPRFSSCAGACARGDSGPRPGRLGFLRWSRSPTQRGLAVLLAP